MRTQTHFEAALDAAIMSDLDIAEVLHTVLQEELVRLEALFPVKTEISLMTDAHSSRHYQMSLIVKIDKDPTKHCWGQSLPEAIAKVEEYAAHYVASHRTMVAADLGLAA